MEEPRYKAHCEWNQQEGIDYEEASSIVIKYSLLRFLFALATKGNHVYYSYGC